MTFRFLVSCLALAGLLLSVQVTNAQTPQTPAQALSQFPNGGPDMVTQVQSLLNADKSNLSAIIAFAKGATEDQRKAIAQGLADVAKAYAANDPAFANQIQQQVASSGIPELAKAYAEAAGDTGTASTGGGGGGAGGGQVAALPTGGQNNSTFPSSSPVPTTPGFIPGGAVGGSSFFSTNTTNVTNTTTTNQVSTF